MRLKRLPPSRIYLQTSVIDQIYRKLRFLIMKKAFFSILTAALALIVALSGVILLFSSCKEVKVVAKESVSEESVKAAIIAAGYKA